MTRVDAFQVVTLSFPSASDAVPRVGELADGVDQVPAMDFVLPYPLGLAPLGLRGRIVTSTIPVVAISTADTE